MKRLLAGLIFIMLLSEIQAQEIIQPNYGLKSPETAELIRIRLNASETVLDLSIENHIEGGFFCIDKNSYLISNSGDRLKLVSVSGLPACPDIHKFGSIGEKVYFSLKFPAIKGRADWFNLIEDCGENCLGIYAIVLNNELNTEINRAFAELNSGANDLAIKEFEDILLSLRETNHGILGSIYLNLIDLYELEGKSGMVNKLVDELKNSNIPEKGKYILILAKKGY